MAKRPTRPVEQQAPITGPRDLPLVALRETVIFPEMIVPLQVGREKSVNALNAAVAEGTLIALVTQRQAEQEDIDDPSELYAVGTLAKIAQVVQLQDGTVRAIVQGQSRLRVLGFEQSEPYLRATIEELPDQTPDGLEVQALMRTVQAQIEQYVANGAPVPPEAAVAARNITEPGLLADMVAYSPDMSTEQRQELLETIDVVERLKLVTDFLAHQVEILELKGRIQSEVKSEMDKTQREYILREQLKAIQRELGEEDPQQAEINELREKVEAAGMPDEIKTRAIKEIDRMSRIPSASPEVGVIRTYVDWLVGLPWNVSTDDQLDIKEAARILDEDHYGLEKIKERILEYLAVRTLADEIRSPILAFVGPPAWARPRSARSIAKAMGRKFVRMSLGGIHDEAEIRGHRRTYIGALPGRISPEHQDRRLEQPGVHARRGRQDRHGLPGRSVVRAARGPRPGAEQHLPGQLPRGAVRPVQGPLRGDRRTCSIRSRPPCVTGWKWSTCPGYTEQEKIEIGKRFLDPQADDQPRPQGQAHRDHGRRDDRARPLVHPRGRRPQPRARARPTSCARSPGRSPKAASARRSSTRRSWLTCLGPPALRVRRAGAGGPDRLGNGPRRDRGRRRCHRHRGHPDGRQGRLHPDRPAGRGHARERPGRPVLDAGQCALTGHRSRGLREEHPAHPRARRGDPQGRSVRRASRWPRPWSAP
ncbi:MAG: LON peptidase substrate-binding domain-containing protein [Candidatus Limnocylindrales bacterium]